jgi:hypothetical protein
MIVGQVLVDGVVYSCHRYPEPQQSVPTVRRLLEEMAAAEGLGRLGKLEIMVHSQRGIERLMAALWGKTEPAHDEGRG